MKGGEAIIKSLQNHGVDVVFGYPGGFFSRYMM